MKNILCFGDSNTWGYNPVTGERFPEGVRWTSLLQERFGKEEVNILEEGLCGRTTVYEDATRPDRKGIDSLPTVFQNNQEIDTVVFMLGTNDCKTYNHTSAKDIAKGIDQCLDIVLEHVAAEQILLVSPIHLGNEVWREDCDPEFDKNSVKVSKRLKQEYRLVADQKKVHFLAASDYVSPSKEDQEHMNPEGHQILAKILYDQIKNMKQRSA